MSASMLQTVIRNCLRQHTTEWIVPITSVQVRYAGQVKARKAKLPNVGKTKPKWTPKVAYNKKEEVSSKKKKKTVLLSTDTPTDNVWLHSHYVLQRNSLEGSINKHRELAQPAMLNNMDGLVYFEAKIDMNTTKKIKFIKAFSTLLILPHEFQVDSQRNIAVICDKEEDRTLATEMGVQLVGGLDLVRAIEKGEVLTEDFDVLLTTNEMLSSLRKIRNNLQEKYPSKSNQTISDDVKKLIEYHQRAICVTVVKESESVGKLQAPIGRLNMENHELVANYEAYIPKIHQKKPTKTKEFITELSIIAPPSDEKFFLKLDDYRPREKSKAELAEELEKEDDEEDQEDQEEEAQA